MESSYDVFLGELRQKDRCMNKDAESHLKNVSENFSMDLGFDNSSQLDDEGNPPIYSFVAGMNNSYSVRSVIIGDQNVNSLGFVTVIGSNNTTYQFQTIVGDLNDFSKSVNVAVLGQSNRDNGAIAAGAIIAGNVNEVTARNVKVLGNQNSVAAKSAVVAGDHLTIPNVPENEGGFFFGSRSCAISVRVNRSVANPLYVSGGSEPEMLPEPGFSTRYKGHWLAEQQNIRLTRRYTIDQHYTLELDHDQFARWSISNAETVAGGPNYVALSFVNWQDGDRGELVLGENVALLVQFDMSDEDAVLAYNGEGCVLLELRKEFGRLFARVLYPLHD